jgi:hypothetical protein
MRKQVAVVACEPVHTGSRSAGPSNQRIQRFKRV